MDMSTAYQFLMQINIAQILVIFGGLWFFYSRLDKKITKLDDKLSNKIEDVDRRLCRIEGSLSSQGHCLYSQSNKLEQKAE